MGRKFLPYSALGGLFVAGFYWVSRTNFLLFHVLIEVMSVVVAGGIYVVAWNTRHLVKNHYLTLIGIGFLFVGFLDLIHTLAYSGMGVFDDPGPNLATQLWVSARYLQAAAFLIAPFAIDRKPRAEYLAAGFGLATAVLVALIWQGIFPDCYVAGSGLTVFKKGSEMAVAGMFVLAGVLLYRRREQFDRQVTVPVLLALGLTVASELSFILYSDVYDFFNALGHLLKLGAFYLFYKALLETAFRKPIDLLFHDLRERELALRESEGRLRLMIESAEDVILMQDAEGRYLYYSGPERFGVRGRDVVGKSPLDLFEAGEALPILAQVKEIFESGEPRTVENKVCWRGETLWFSDVVYPVRDEGGQVIAVAKICRNVTERKLLEDELSVYRERLESEVRERTADLERANQELGEQLLKVEASERARRQAEQTAELQRMRSVHADRLRSLGEMAAVMAHDLNQPLQGVRGIAEHVYLTLKRGWKTDNADLMNKSRMIVEQADRMTHVIKHILRFGRDSDRSEQSLVDANDVIRAGTVLISPQLKAAGHQLVLDLCAFPLPVMANRFSLEEVILNLVTNARDAMAGSNKDAIVIKSSLTGDECPMARIEVIDTGEGISEDRLGRVFDPFYTSKEPGKGTGLGLSISRALIEEAGGTLDLESSVGRGTRGVILLPVAEGEEIT